MNQGGDYNGLVYFNYLLWLFVIDGFAYWYATLFVSEARGRTEKFYQSKSYVVYIRDYSRSFTNRNWYVYIHG